LRGIARNGADLRQIAWTSKGLRGVAKNAAHGKDLIDCLELSRFWNMQKRKDFCELRCIKRAWKRTWTRSNAETCSKSMHATFHKRNFPGMLQRKPLYRDQLFQNVLVDLVFFETSIKYVNQFIKKPLLKQCVRKSKVFTKLDHIQKILKCNTAYNYFLCLVKPQCFEIFSVHAFLVHFKSRKVSWRHVKSDQMIDVSEKAIFTKNLTIAAVAMQRF